MDLCLSLPFPLRLPRNRKRDEEIAEKYDIRGLHLLAAEDNELNAEIIEMLLTDDGAKVTVAKTADRRWSTSKIILREPLMPY